MKNKLYNKQNLLKIFNTNTLLKKKKINKIYNLWLTLPRLSKTKKLKFRIKKYYKKKLNYKKKILSQLKFFFYNLIDKKLYWFFLLTLLIKKTIYRKKLKIKYITSLKTNIYILLNLHKIFYIDLYSLNGYKFCYSNSFNFKNKNYLMQPIYNLKILYYLYNYYNKHTINITVCNKKNNFIITVYKLSGEILIQKSLGTYLYKYFKNKKLNRFEKRKKHFDLYENILNIFINYNEKKNFVYKFLKFYTKNQSKSIYFFRKFRSFLQKYSIKKNFQKIEHYHITAQKYGGTREKKHIKKRKRLRKKKAFFKTKF